MDPEQPCFFYTGVQGPVADGESLPGTPYIHQRNGMVVPLAEPIIMEAYPTLDRSGWVDVGKVLTIEEAATRRTIGLDVVVCGDDHMTNRRLATKIEGMVGPVSRAQPPHKGSAGPHALPHYHQDSRVPRGHTFYETPNLRARR